MFLYHRQAIFGSLQGAKKRKQIARKKYIFMGE